MLYLIGLGLGDAKDITVKGLEIVKQCSRVYLEAYTSVLTVGKEALEEFYGRELMLADRETVEQEADEILKDADISDVAFLVVGDPFGATTHSDLVLRAVRAGIPYRVIHNASIMNAVGCCGLQLYNFGETVSIVFWTDTWKPESFYDKIVRNRQNGMHTLCLLDIKVKEQSLENLMKGKKIYEPPQYMSVNRAAEQLLEIIQNRRDQGLQLGNVLGFLMQTSKGRMQLEKGTEFLNAVHPSLPPPISMDILTRKVFTVS
ncbi:diphthine methyl ester synthase isoform X2 [Rhinatrema bivittatum]|uniref:diphthine methyl ester synthase isoform X2 n=1 Tax=Rhinatrema bivittatum TaxID=194408 RepID=UPI001129A0F4|nr:diphthine methyl ester synthase isoform X2 [Rhinatrema bivittatum]